MHRRTPTRSLVATLTSVTIAAAALAGSAHAAEDGSKLAVRLTETYSKEQRTTVSESFNSTMTETSTVSTGQVRLDFQLPVSDAASIDGETALVVRAGHFEFRATFDSDPAYRAGQHRATLRMTRPGSSSKTTVTLATAKVDWSGGKLTGHIEGRLPNVRDIAGEDFAGEAAGKVQGEVEVTVTCGAASESARVPLEGTVAHTDTHKDSTTVSSSKVILRGDNSAHGSE